LSGSYLFKHGLSFDFHGERFFQFVECS
jgi:hypothetical protein